MFTFCYCWVVVNIITRKGGKANNFGIMLIITMMLDIVMVAVVLGRI